MADTNILVVDDENEIAELVGYSDWHYLYSVYKKQLGHSMSKEKRRKNP